MRTLFIIGVILVLLGVLSLFVPIPVHEKHAIKAGPLSMGVETTENRKVDPVVTVVLVAGGVVLALVARKGVR
jgi:hypothetical protein